MIPNGIMIDNTISAILFVNKPKCFSLSLYTIKQATIDKRRVNKCETE